MKKIETLIKKVLVIFFVTCIILMNEGTILAQASTDPSKGLQGSVQMNTDKENKNLFTGKTQEVQKGTRLKMTVSQVMSSGYNAEGDEFFAEVTDDLNAPGGITIPSGTVAHGKVTMLRGTKRLGRDAYMSVKFDYLITPDGREIPIDASMTTKRGLAVSAGKVVLQDTAITLAGGVIGGILALKYLGIPFAIATHGYSVAAGAGAGAAIGATASLVRKGKEVLIAPGDQIDVQVATSMQLPIMSEDALKDDEKLLDGLDVSITDCKIEKDPFGEANTITLTLDINNHTSRTFSSFDMALVNDYNSVFYPSPFGDTELWFEKITPNSRATGKLSFAVDNPKRKHWLVFYDTSTRKPLARISIQNAERRLKKEKEEAKAK